jgi:uncharacterized phage protein (TIGR01671 family)
MSNSRFKFRAWDKRFASMDYGRGDLLLRTNSEDFSEVMQYTGLKDKNDVEIYCGDIVVSKMYNVYSEKIQTIKGIVEFTDGSFKVNTKFLADLKDIEIIGNIHET